MVAKSKSLPKKEMVIKWPYWIIFITILFALSYLREVSFLSINAYIDGQDTFYAKTTEIPFFKDLTINQLIRFKYFMTVAYTILFIGFTSWGLFLSFKNKIAYQLSIVVYAFATLIVLLLLSSLLFLSFEAIFSHLRDLAHLIHNPLLFLLLSISSFGLSLKKPQEI